MCVLVPLIDAHRSACILLCVVAMLFRRTLDPSGVMCKNSLRSVFYGIRRFYSVASELKKAGSKS
jgi:hypothetical protein